MNRKRYVSKIDIDINDYNLYFYIGRISEMLATYKILVEDEDRDFFYKLVDLINSSDIKSSL